MNDVDEIEALDRITQILIARTEQMGVAHFSLKGVPLDLADTMDQEGPLPWALFLHSSIISKLTGIEGMPFKSVSGDYLFKNRAGIASGKLPLSFAYHFLDAALEHAVVAGLQKVGCTLDEWNQLPEELRVLPIEAYFDDLQANWVSDHLEFGTMAEQVVKWPTLLDFASYEESLDLNQRPSPIDGMRINSIVSFAPKQ